MIKRIHVYISKDVSNWLRCPKKADRPELLSNCRACEWYEYEVELSESTWHVRCKYKENTADKVDDTMVDDIVLLIEEAMGEEACGNHDEERSARLAAVILGRLGRRTSDNSEEDDSIILLRDTINELNRRVLVLESAGSEPTETAASDDGMPVYEFRAEMPEDTLKWEGICKHANTCSTGGEVPKSPFPAITPGEWKVTPQPDDTKEYTMHGHIDGEPHPELIVEHVYGWTPEHRKNNAVLIAAAPKLMTALYNLIIILDRQEVGSTLSIQIPSNEMYDQAIKALREAGVFLESTENDDEC